MSITEDYTIILGAEGELGRAMARAIARAGCNLILVSTTRVDLQRFAIGLQLKEEVQVDALRLDLADREAVNRFLERIRKQYEIRALVNNITCDWSARDGVCISEIAKEDFQTRFRGAALITWGLLPLLSSRSSAYIQHIVPFPFRKEEFSPELQQSVTKMVAFARELEEEVKHSTVSVSILHPAPIRNLFPRFDMEAGLNTRDMAMTPEMIANRGIRGMLRGERVIIPGFWNRVQFFLNRQATSWFRSPHESLGSNLQPSV